MAAFPNFDTSNSGLDFDVLGGLNFGFMPLSESQQRQTENGNRNNDSATASSLVSSASLTSQASHNFYSSLSSNMLPTPEGSDNNAMCPESLMLSPYNMLPGSGHLTMEDPYNKDEDFFYEPLESPESGVSFIPNYISAASYLSPQTSPTLPPDASMNINPNSPTRRQSQEKRFSPINKPKKVSPNNKNSASQSRRKSSFTNSNNVNGNNSSNNNSNNSANGQNNAITNLSNIMTGSPDKLPNNSIAMFSLLELTSPLMNDVVATSIAPSLQDNMPNLNLGSNLESDVTSAYSSTSNRPIESSSSDKLAPITPSSLMKLQKKQPNSPKSIQNESNTNSQQQQQKQQNQQDQSQQQKDYSAFIAPTPPTLNQIRPNMIATTGAASPSGAKKSIRTNPNASSPLALGPSKSPHSLKPTISPNLKPKLPGVLANEIAVAEQLANKSNYRSILEGTAQSLGISYPSDVHSSLESRRTTHKAAEQKRRDSLKQSFDELKKVVPYQSVLSKADGNVANNNNSKGSGNGKSGDGTMKNVSKLFLLKRAHDHIVELEQKTKEKDEIIQNLKDELDLFKRAKKQKVEETEKKENVCDGVDIETKSKNERQITSNEC